FILAQVGMVCLIIVVLQLEPKMWGVRRVAKSVLTGWLVVSLLIAAVLSVSPSLHHHLHPDASKHSHSCAATLLEQGKVTLTVVALFFLAFVSLCIFCLSPVLAARPSLFDLRLCFGRAPPVLSFLPSW
ncbi:MAG: hypothetical protein QOD03_977, partial [Verrucomicrobiota bacterium]